MFFFGIFGVNSKVKNIKEFANTICICGRYSRLELMEEYMYFHFFFIPLFKWGRKYFVEARCCSRVFGVPKDYVEDLLIGDAVDIKRLMEVDVPYKVCSNCNNYVDSHYKYCPHCGKEF